MKKPTSKIPVKTGQEITLKIDNYGHDGEGVGRFQDYTIFVPAVLKGETALVRITEVKKNYARGVLRSIRQSSPARVKPACPVYRDCGGCQLQHLDYQAQLELKRQTVVEAVTRIGGFKQQPGQNRPEITVHPTLGMPEPWFYRNKVQYPLGVENVTVVMGFYQRGTHRIVPVRDCLLQPSISNRVAQKIRELLEKYHVSIYDEQTGSGLLRHLLIRTGYKTGEVMVVLITSEEKFLNGEKIARDLISLFPEIKSVIQNINPVRGNVILGPESKTLWGNDTIVEQIGKLKFKISATSFFQINPIQTEILYRKAVEYAGLTGKEIVLDAYCGVGSLSLFLAEHAKKVYGIEVVAEAVKNATENAALNEIKNTHFLVGEVERTLPQLVKGGISFHTAVLDPPRSGCEESVLKSLAENHVKRIVYVSCNPSTLARDLKILGGLGYQPVEIQPVDMFPHTFHVECVALMCASSEAGKC